MSHSVLRGRPRAGPPDHLLRSAYSLMLNVVLGAALGLGFWVLAARLFPTSEVGQDSALVSALLTLSSVSQLNLHNAIPRFLPQVADAGKTLRSAYLLTTGVATVVATLFVLLVPRVAPGLAFLGEDRALAITFVVATALWSVFALQDAALTAFRRAPWVPLENGGFSASKLALLPVALALGIGHAPFLAWVVAMVIPLVAINWLLFRRLAPAHRALREERATPVLDRRRIARFIAKDYAGSIFMHGTLTLIPILVASLLGARSTAHFFMAFTIVTSFDMLFTNAAMALTVEAAFAEGRARALALRSVRRFAPLLLGGVLVLVAAAPLLLLPFGSQYADEATTALRLMAVASLFRGVLALVGSIARIEGHGEWLVGMHGAVFCVQVALTVMLATPLGIDGVAVAWVVATGSVAAFMLPRVLRFLRGADAALVA